MRLEHDIFYCENLLANEKNIKLLRTFHVEKETGAGLEAYLKRMAINDEAMHYARTYLVIDKTDNTLVGYFSLKAGTVATRIKKRFFHLEMDSIPAIELANFAVNDNYKTSHENRNGLGEIIFFYFILPICRSASDYVGINTLYIYALPYQGLIRYYEQMHFKRVPDNAESIIHRYHKPRYDKGCIFMFRPLHAES